MAVQLPLPSKLSVLLCAGLVVGCARSAPQLPPDYGSVHSKEKLTLENFSEEDRLRTCDTVERDMAAIISEVKAVESGIEAKHRSNEVAGYFAGVLFPPLILATDHSTEAKKILEQRQARWDQLLALKRVKNCSF